jgi:hypothetical protein
MLQSSMRPDVALAEQCSTVQQCSINRDAPLRCGYKLQSLSFPQCTLAVSIGFLVTAVCACMPAPCMVRTNALVRVH